MGLKWKAFLHFHNVHRIQLCVALAVIASQMTTTKTALIQLRKIASMPIQLTIPTSVLLVLKIRLSPENPRAIFIVMVLLGQMIIMTHQPDCDSIISFTFLSTTICIREDTLKI